MEIVVLKCDNKRWSAIDERMERSKTDEWSVPNKKQDDRQGVFSFSCCQISRVGAKIGLGEISQSEIKWQRKSEPPKVERQRRENVLGWSRRNSDTCLSQLASKLWSEQNCTVRGRAKTKIGLSSVLNQEWRGNNIRTHLR